MSLVLLQGRPVAVTEFSAMSDETVKTAVAEAGLMSALERNCEKVCVCVWMDR